MSVETLISQAQGYAATIANQANSAMQSASNAVLAVGYSIPNFYPVALPSTPPTEVSLSVPVMDTVTLDLPDEPAGSLVFQDISTFDAGVAPTFSATMPTVTLPTEPSQIAQFTGTAPAIDTSIAFPSPPAELLNPLIQAPTLTDRDEPDKPQTALPAFTAMTPLDKLASLPEADQGLRAGVTLEHLRALAMALTDVQAAEELNAARQALFNQVPARTG